TFRFDQAGKIFLTIYVHGVLAVVMPAGVDRPRAESSLSSQSFPPNSTRHTENLRLLLFIEDDRHGNGILLSLVMPCVMPGGPSSPEWAHSAHHRGNRPDCLLDGPRHQGLLRLV